MTFEEWWESYLNSEPSDTFLRDEEFAKFVWESAQETLLKECNSDGCVEGIQI